MNSQPFLSADTTTQILTGRITHYNPEKKFGFIRDSDNNDWFFHYNWVEQVQLKKSGEKNAMHDFHPGDQVNFKLRPNLKDASKMVAHNLVYIRNFYREQLKEDALQNKIIRGTLIKKEDNYFIKHPQAEIFIPVTISKWETDLQLTYEQRVGQTVSCTLSSSESFKNMRAFISGRRFSDRYVLLLQLKAGGRSVPATILRSNHRGLLAKILDNIMVFALMPKELTEEQQNHFFRFNSGEKVMVKIKDINNYGAVSVTIVE